MESKKVTMPAENGTSFQTHISSDGHGESDIIYVTYQGDVRYINPGTGWEL
jgi:hypothetical protein